MLYNWYLAGYRQKALSGELVDEDDEANGGAPTANPFRPIAVNILCFWCFVWGGGEE